MPYNAQYLQFNIKQRLKMRKTTVKQMCEDLQLHVNFVNTLDKYSPLLPTICNIADYLECTVDDLLKQPFT